MLTPLRFTVNGRSVSEMVEPRTHLADFLRDKLNLTGTHLRCEQGVCGVCTVLIDGQPARSCITYAVFCQDAEVTTIEGLENDSVIESLRGAFSAEHGLQCGYCTPAMLVTARDIVLRLPEADSARVRRELGGNLCRCTGYVGIVRAVCRVLEEYRTQDTGGSVPERSGFGPVGSHVVSEPAAGGDSISKAATKRTSEITTDAIADIEVLGSRQPNVSTNQSFVVSRPPQTVWEVLEDIELVARCLPGAKLTATPNKDRLQGNVSVKLGPVSAKFMGQGRLERDARHQRGIMVGAGRDSLSSTRAIGEISYQLSPIESGNGTRVDLKVRALLQGPLAQFGRSGIVDDLSSRITDEFARNLETHLSEPTVASSDAATEQEPLKAGSMLWDMLLAHVRSIARRVMFRRRG